MIALGALIYWRQQFEIRTPTGKLAMGMLIGGIVGNLIDRVAYQHGDEIYVELTDSLSPGVIKSNTPFLYVLMPMRTN